MIILKSFSYRFFLSIIALLFGVHQLTGQGDVYVIHELGSKQGLSDNRYNYYIHQDTIGFVWISSIAGLNRFDGRHVKPYTPKENDPNALRSVYASSSYFYDTPDGDLWFTEDEALLKYNRQDDNFERHYALDADSVPIQSGYRWAYLDDLSGLLWFKIEEEGRKSIVYTCNTRKEGYPIKYISELNVGIKDKMIRTPGGKYRLFSIVDKKLQVYTLDKRSLLAEKRIPIPAGVIVNGILPIDESKCWIASSNGLYLLDVDTEDWQAHHGSYENEQVDDIHEVIQWRSSYLLLATGNNGIYFYDITSNTYSGKIHRYHNNEITPFHPTVERIYVDATDNLWVSASNAGVYYTNLCKPKFDLELVGKDVVAMTGSENLPIVLGLESVYYFKNGQLMAISLPMEGGSQVRGKCLFEDVHNRLWLGTQSSLYYKNPDEHKFRLFDQFPEELSLKPRHFTSITALPNENILVSNSTQAPIRIQLKDLSAHLFGPVKNTGSAFIRYSDGYIFTDYNHNRFKIYRISDAAFVEDSTFHSLPVINNMVQDSLRGCYWIATDNGLYQLSQNSALNWKLELENNLNEKVISSLLVDRNGQLWMGTPRGLLRYHPDTGEQHLYNSSDLLQDYHFYRTSAWKAKDGTFFFGGANGINHFDPLKVSSEITDAKPLVVDILINQQSGVAYQYSKRKTQNPHLLKYLKLPFHKNNVVIHLSAGEYSDPEACRFIYKLNGSNQPPDTIKSRILRFNNLSQGGYTLEIWAVNADGKRSPEAHTLEVIIRPPLHRSPEAILFYLAVLFLGGYSFYKYRLRQITKQQQLEQEAAETETAVLRLQMNPHFIFNCLVAIKSLVNKDDRKSALTFLSRFSKLMRKILDESTNQLNSLEEEKKLLENYLALEQLRFPNRVTYDFYIDPALDTYETLLPTMILQPFVENAIVHGIRHKATPGHIQINFLAANDGYLRCEVRDNGVGRGAQLSDASHESKATKITMRRLEVLTISKKLDRTPGFEIIDEFNEDGTPAGTSVCFLFPPFY